MCDPSGDFDTALELCLDSYRRIVLSILSKQRRALSLNDLTKFVSTSDQHQPIPDLDSPEVVRIATELHHLHLPKLVDANVIEYDVDRKLVTPTSTLSRLEPHLTAIIALDPAVQGNSND